MVSLLRKPLKPASLAALLPHPDHPPYADSLQLSRASTGATSAASAAAAAGGGAGGGAGAGASGASAGSDSAAAEAKRVQRTKSEAGTSRFDTRIDYILVSQQPDGAPQAWQPWQRKQAAATRIDVVPHSYRVQPKTDRSDHRLVATKIRVTPVQS